MKRKERDRSVCEISCKCASATPGQLLRHHQRPTGCARVHQDVAPDTDPALTDRKNSHRSGGPASPPAALPLIANYNGTGAARVRRVLTGTGCYSQESSTVPGGVSPGLRAPPSAAAASAPCPPLRLQRWISGSLPFPAKGKTWQWGNKGGFLLEWLSVW